MDQDSATITVKAVYCPGAGQEEIRRFNFPLPLGGDSAAESSGNLYDELRRRIAAACTACIDANGLNLYYVDADQERVRFSTSEELVQLLRLHHHQQPVSGSGDGSGGGGATLRILAEPSGAPAAAPADCSDGAEHPGVRCDGCNQCIRGRRFRCFQCPDYDLCQRCILRGLHDHHSMLVLHRPGDADSLPPWISRMAAAAGSTGPWMWGGGGRPGFFPWQQQQQQPQQQQPQMFARPPWTGRFGGRHPGMPNHPYFHHFQQQMPQDQQQQQQQQQQQPQSAGPMFACPKLARKMEKARRKFEAKMAKRCDRLQHKLARKHLQQQQQQQQASKHYPQDSASGTADEPIRIDIDEQLQQQLQQQQQLLSPEEAMLLKQLKKRHKQHSAASAAGSKKKAKHHSKHHHHHHKKGHGGRKRRRSLSSSSSSSSSSSGSSDGSSSSSSGSSSDSDSDAEQKNYRQLLKKFRKMGFKDDETCWLRALIREKRGNLNEILDAIRQRGAANAAAASGRDV